MSSRTGMRMGSSREGICGNNAVQFQSCDGSSYCTALGEKALLILSLANCEIREVSRFSARSEAIASRDLPPIVPRVWTRHYE